MSHVIKLGLSILITFFSSRFSLDTASLTDSGSTFSFVLGVHFSFSFEDFGFDLRWMTYVPSCSLTWLICPSRCTIKFVHIKHDYKI